MIEISQQNENISIKNDDKKTLTLNTNSFLVSIEDYEISFPGEYEKGWILAQVKSFGDSLFYNLKVDGIHMTILPTDNFEPNENTLKFLENIDVLLILGTKKSAKLFENIEAKVVIPYGEEKHSFFTTEGQHPEAIKTYKIKWDLTMDDTLFVNLED